MRRKNVRADQRPAAEKASNSYRRMLMDKRAEVLSHLGMKPEAYASAGRVGEEDQASVSHEEFISLCLNRLEYENLRLVDEALDRLDSGEYGTCLRCDEPIPVKRLRALPWAKYCVRCQEEVTPATPLRLEKEAAYEPVPNW